MKPRKSPLAIGITGGIGSGKTAATEAFASLGARVRYADRIAKDLVNTDERVRRRIKREFGDQVYAHDGTLDNKQIAKRVFNDPLALDTLNEIVHPSVLEFIGQEIKFFKRIRKEELLIVEAALLFEAEADGVFDYIIVVDAEEEERIRRVVARDGSTRSDVLQRMQAQMSASEKVERADFVIQNNGDRKALEERCRFIFTILQTIVQTSVDRS